MAQAQALGSLIDNPSTLAEMVEAWDGIDFESIKSEFRGLGRDSGTRR